MHGPNRESPLPLLRGSIRSHRLASLLSRAGSKISSTPLSPTFHPLPLSIASVPINFHRASSPSPRSQLISIYSSFPPPLPYLPPNANAAPFVPPRLIFYNFIDWHRIVQRVDAIVRRRIHTRTCRLCDSPFLQIILFGSLCRRRDGPSR